jgi:hypothetical protein
VCGRPYAEPVGKDLPIDKAQVFREVLHTKAILFELSLYSKKKKKTKLSRYRPGQALGVPGG